MGSSPILATEPLDYLVTALIYVLFLLHLCCITVRVTQELLPLSSSLQRGSQEVRGHVRELGGLPVGVDGPLKHVVTAQLLGHVVLCLHTEPC